MATYKSEGTAGKAVMGGLSGAVAGLGTGAAVGQAILPIPGVGAAVGAVVGLIAGGVQALVKKRKANIQAKAAADARLKQSNLEFAQARKAQKFQSNPMSSTQQMGSVTPASFSPQEAGRIQKVFDPNQETYGSMFMESGN